MLRTKKTLAFDGNIELANNMDYKTFAELSGFVSYQIAFPTDVIKTLNEDFENIVSIYKERELSPIPHHTKELLLNFLALTLSEQLSLCNSIYKL